MKKSVGRGFLFFGIALVIATAIRALANMLQAEHFDPWTVVLTAGCIFISIGWGILRKR